MPIFSAYSPCVMAPNLLAGFVNYVALPPNLDAVLPAERPCKLPNPTQSIYYNV